MTVAGPHPTYTFSQLVTFISIVHINHVDCPESASYLLWVLWLKKFLSEMLGLYQ